MKNIPEMDEEEYWEHSNDFDGVCKVCEEIKYGGCEPDAENYPCEECGEDAVVGMELALIWELIHIV